MIKVKKATARNYNRLVLGGEPNSGKTTAAVRWDENSLWIDLDKRIPKDCIDLCTVAEYTKSFSGIDKVLKDILNEDKFEYTSLIIDHLSILETLAREHSITQDYNGNEHLYASYSQGDKQELPIHFNRLLSLMDRIADKHGCDIVLLCHSDVKKLKNPNGEDYDKNILMLVDKVRNRVLQWADYIGFCWKKVEVVESGLSKKATGKGERIITFNSDPRFDAKGPIGLPEEIPLDHDGDWVSKVKESHMVTKELPTRPLKTKVSEKPERELA